MPASTGKYRLSAGWPRKRDLSYEKQETAALAFRGHFKSLYNWPRFLLVSSTISWTWRRVDHSKVRHFLKSLAAAIRGRRRLRNKTRETFAIRHIWKRLWAAHRSSWQIREEESNFMRSMPIDNGTIKAPVMSLQITSNASRASPCWFAPKPTVRKANFELWKPAKSYYILLLGSR